LKLLLLNCPTCISTEDVMTHYRGLMGRNTVECVKWFHNGSGMFIGSGILVFDSEASVEEAALLPGPTIMGRQVEVESPMGGSSSDKGSELYLWGLPPSAVEEDVRMYYANAGLMRLKFKMTPDYSSTVGVAFANFESPEAAMKALEMGPPEIRGVKCYVKPSGYQGEKEVCIRGSENLTDAVLRKQYAAFGADGILSIQWQRVAHAQLASRRAFVCFKTADMASQALTLGNFVLGDEVMEVFQTGKRFKVLDKEGPANESGTDAVPVPTAVPDTAVPPLSGTPPTPSWSGARITPLSCTAPSSPLSTTAPSPYEDGVHTSAPAHCVPPTLRSPYTQCTTSPSTATTPSSRRYTIDGWRTLWQPLSSEASPHHIPVDAGARTPPSPYASSASLPLTPTTPSSEWHTEQWFTDHQMPVDLREVERQVVAETGRRLLAQRLRRQFRSFDDEDSASDASSQT
jgi:hypothetical protein